MEDEMEANIYERSCAVCEIRPNLESCTESYLNGDCRYCRIKKFIRLVVGEQ